MDTSDIQGTSGKGTPAAADSSEPGFPAWLQYLLAAAVFAWLGVRQLMFVNTHAVNVLYWDQWDFYRPLFENQGWWETFTRQHGPHREGLGLVLTRLIADASGWNSRWEAFAVCLIMIGAAAAALVLASRFGTRSRPILLAAVPLLFLNTHEYEIYVGAVNLSYAAVPMALLMAYCLSWFLRGRALRLGAVTALTFMLVFTGFGMFAGLLTPPLLALEAGQAWRAGERRHAAWVALALALACASWALFARGYTFQPAVAGFRFPYEHPAQYLLFIARMLGHFYGAPLLSAPEIALGLAVAAALVAIAAWNGARCAVRGVEKDPRGVVLFCLSAFSILFCVNCAVGRVFMGPIAPYSSRYDALLIPAGVAILLQAAALAQRRPFRWTALAYTALLVPATAVARPYEVWGANWYTEGRAAWKAEYLRTLDQAAADKAAHFPIYPGNLDDRLEYVRQHQLNLFLPPSGP